MNWTANTDLLNRPTVGLGVGEPSSAMNSFSLRNKFAVSVGADLCAGGISAFRASIPTQMTGGRLLERPVFTADDRDRRFIVHVVVHVGKAIPVNRLCVPPKVRESLCEMRPQSFTTATGTTVPI